MSSTASGPLAGIRSKIEWTKKHVAHLGAAIRAFRDSNPYKIGTNRDPDTRQLIYYVTHVADVPEDVPQIVHDVLGNMVSTLDHLAFRLFLKGGTGGSGRHVYFPISRDATNAAEYVASRERKVKGMPPHVVAALDALEPYQGGKGHQLWVLSELNNLSKHRDLIAVGGRFKSMDIGAYMVAHMGKTFGRTLPALPAFVKPADPLCPLKVGDKLFIAPPDAEPDEKMQFNFDVALNEPQIIHAEPLIETVHQMSGLVDGIVSQFAKYL